MLVHALIVAVLWWRVRRIFDRAMHDRPALSEQRSCWPMMILLLISGSTLFLRILGWMWSQGHVIWFGAAVGGAGYWLMKNGREIRDGLGPDRDRG